MGHRKTIAALIAIVSILLNAVIVVRHSTSMLDGHFQYASLLSALKVHCSSLGGLGSIPTEDLPDVPPIYPGHGDCPVCSGMSTSAAVLPDLTLPGYAPDTASMRLAMVAEVLRRTVENAAPLPRGPPSIS